MPRFLNEIIGDYRLVDFIGAGGMGEVYRAIHTQTGRVVAIKALTSSDDPTRHKRFLNEAHIHAQLRHPSIVEFYQQLDWHGRPVIAMEYADGETIGDIIQRRGPFSGPEAKVIIRAIASAVDYMHSLGILHRDLKTSNIKLTSSGAVKLLDFGIAREREGERLTRTGFVIGTFESIAPEQAQGGQPSVASDIWGLGVILYEMIIGRGPFKLSDPTDLLVQIARAEFERPSVVNPATPPDIERVILRCLKRRPADRYRTGRELMEALPVSEAQPLPRPASRFPTLRMPASRDARMGIIGAAVLAVGLLGYVIYRAAAGGEEPVYSQSEHPAKGGSMTTVIDVDSGRAEVYRDGQLLCSTPCPVAGHSGESIRLVLKQEGYRDYNAQFDVSERKAYQFPMERVRR